MKCANASLALLPIVLAVGCEKSVEPLNWPTFDLKVIEAARLATQDRSVQSQGDTVPPVEVAPEPIAATPESVLQAIETMADRPPADSQPALRSVLRLGAEALDPLLELLADDAIDTRYRDRMVGLLFPQPPDHDGEPYRLAADVVIPERGKIFDAVTAYAQQHPESHPYLGSLGAITPLDRLPRLVELIQSSTGELQQTYINVFSGLTYSDFAVVMPGFCGHSSAADVEEARQAMNRRQTESAAAIPLWWQEHGNESPDEWLAAHLRRLIAQHAKQIESIMESVRTGESNRGFLQFEIRVYYPPHDLTWRPSAFAVLVDQYEGVPDYVQPYVLGLIGSTQHADATAFVAPKLKSRNTNIQFAAIAALKELKATAYKEQIGRILRTSDDDDIRRQAVEAIQVLAGPEAVRDLTYALAVPYSNAESYASRALGPYLVSHAVELRRIAGDHPDMQVRQTLRTMLDASAAAHKADPGEQLAAIRQLLRSNNPERQQRGIELAAKHPELIPDVLELIRSQDWNVRRAAIELIARQGIPGLTIRNAPKLLGYSTKLDRQIAAFCYAKYGREAIPIMKQVAFSLRDPEYPMDAPGTKPPGSPAVGLIRALLKEEVPGIPADVVRLVKDRRTYMTYTCLLRLLDDPASAALLGELLNDDQEYTRREAMRIIAERGLQQHADALYDIATTAPEPNERERLQVDFDAGRINAADFGLRWKRAAEGPDDQYYATRALIEIGHLRAWQAVRICLKGEYFTMERGMVFSLGPEAFANFGLAVAALKSEHSRDLRAALLEELAGQNRRHVTIALTAALSKEPDGADAEALWAVASATNVHLAARYFAAAALAKLGQKRVVPLIHDLIRQAVAAGHSGAWPGNDLARVFSGLAGGRKQRMLQPEYSLLDDGMRSSSTLIPVVDREYYDLGLALRRLGDTSMESELVQSLSLTPGKFNQFAFLLLARIAGPRALHHAKVWMEANGFDKPDAMAWPAAMLLDTDLPLERLLPHMMAPETIDSLLLRRLLGRDDPRIAHILVQAYDKLNDRDSRFRTNILDDLCRIGDPRGLALASDDLLRFADLVKYLPDAHGVDYPSGHFTYNRIEETTRALAWYRQNAGGLVWDSEAGEFRLASASP